MTVILYLKSHLLVHWRLLPSVSWCLVEHSVILPIYALSLCTCNKEGFARICTFDANWNYAIFIANQPMSGNDIIGTFAPREMPLFSKNLEKKVFFMGIVSEAFYGEAQLGRVCWLSLPLRASSFALIVSICSLQKKSNQERQALTCNLCLPCGTNTFPSLIAH